MTVSLEEQTVTDGHGFRAKFEIDPFRKFCLLEGLDDIGLTLRHAAALDTFEKQHDEADWLKAKAIEACLKGMSRLEELRKSFQPESHHDFVCGRIGAG